MPVYTWVPILLIMISGLTKVFAAEIYVPTTRSTGYQLLDDVAVLIAKEARKAESQGDRGFSLSQVSGLYPGTRARDLLEDEINRHLNLWFDYIALIPSSQMVERVVDEIFFILVRQTGSSIFLTEDTAATIKSIIRAAVEPLRTRNSQSCISLLLNNRHVRTITVH